MKRTDENGEDVRGSPRYQRVADNQDVSWLWRAVDPSLGLASYQELVVPKTFVAGQVPRLQGGSNLVHHDEDRCFGQSLHMSAHVY